MRMYDIVDAVLGEIEDDATLAQVFGDEVREAGDGPITAPLLQYTVIGDTEQELWEPVMVQFDLFTRTAQQMVSAEIALRKLLHHDVPTELGGIGMWSEYQARRTIPDAPQGIVGVSQDYTFTALRSKYTPTQES